MIAVIDYNVGNVKSVCNAFQHIGCQAKLTGDPQEISEASGIVLPGVAAFGYAMNALGKLAEKVRTLALDGKPMLGICVGHQLLFESSCEHGHNKGLGLIKGEIIPLPPGRVIPHMGWNNVQMPANIELFAGLGDSKHFYFAHSFYANVIDPDTYVASTEYGFELTAAVKKDNIYGVQFHPEKSGKQGLHVLKNFAAICERK